MFSEIACYNLWHILTHFLYYLKNKRKTILSLIVSFSCFFSQYVDVYLFVIMQNVTKLQKLVPIF